MSDDGTTPGEAAGDPGRMRTIQRDRAARGRRPGRGRGGWRLRERASDAGSADRFAAMFDRGRDRWRGRRGAPEPGGSGSGGSGSGGSGSGGVRPGGSGSGGVRPADSGSGGSGSGGVRPADSGSGGGRPGAGQPGRDGRSAAGRRGGRRGRADDGSRETSMVPRAEFQSYYGRPVLKPPVWKDDIAYYFFLGGLAAGSSLLAAGADQTGLPALRKGGRIGALVSLGLGSFYLIHDLGRPERFHHMLRVAKPTSPMSVGTWVLVAYGPGMGLAAISELMPARLRGTPVGRLVDVLARPAGLAAAALAPAVASYTAVLLSQTAVPAWHEAHEELPFIFTASAAASAGGLGMILAPPEQAAPARRLAAYGAVVELAASRRLENRLGLTAEAFTTGEPSRQLERASMLTAGGVLGSMLLGRRSRVAAVLSGAALLAGGFLERLGLLHAGVESTKDPRYVVELQRGRMAEHGPTRVGLPAGGPESSDPAAPPAGSVESVDTDPNR